MDDQKLGNGLPKANRLKSKKAIAELFRHGNALKAPPFVLVYHFQGLEEPMRMGVSVPKKRTKKAVDRNRVKRLIREVFRKERNRFQRALIKKGCSCHVMIIFTGRQIPDMETTSHKISLLLDRLLSVLEEKEE